MIIVIMKLFFPENRWRKQYIEVKVELVETVSGLKSVKSQLKFNPDKAGRGAANRMEPTRSRSIASLCVSKCFATHVIHAFG